MDWEEIYEKVVDGICKQDYRNFDNIVEQPQPEFEDKLIVDENHGDNDLYMKRLDEDVADEDDYKAFCEYIFNYIGEDIESFINEGKEKRFSSFNKPNKEEE